MTKFRKLSNVFQNFLKCGEREREREREREKERKSVGKKTMLCDPKIRKKMASPEPSKSIGF